jgi:hypothetical protein
VSQATQLRSTIVLLGLLQGMIGGGGRIIQMVSGLSEAPSNETLEAFEAAFATLRYVRCTDASLELRYEKIAIYASTAGVPTHAARQLHTGRWTSKLGHLEDIEHSSPDALISNSYGSPVLFMRRRLGVFQLALRLWTKLSGP